MKKILLALTLLFAAFFNACQENSITDPINNSTLTKTSQYNSIQDGRKGCINICCMVQDPFSGACALNGEIIFTHEILNSSISDNINNLKDVQITMDVNASLCDRMGMVHPYWGIRDYSYDVLFVSEEGIRILEKRFAVLNRSDIQIEAIFIVTTEGVGLSSMRIVNITSNHHPVFVSD